MRLRDNTRMDCILIVSGVYISGVPEVMHGNQLRKDGY